MLLQVVVYVQRLIAKHAVSAPNMSAVPYFSDLLSMSDCTLHIFEWMLLEAGCNAVVCIPNLHVDLRYSPSTCSPFT